MEATPTFKPNVLVPLPPTFHAISHFSWIPNLHCIMAFFSKFSVQLTCHRSQDFCQLSSKRIIGAKTENFPLKTLSSADWVDVGGENSASGVILNPAQGDKEMVSLFPSEAEEMAKEINAFISNSQQESLQVSSSNATAAWVIFW